MINDQSKCYEVTIIAKNEKGDKWNVLAFNHNSTVLDAK